ncbi:MAG: MBL fold metallo-hydrolase [Kiritimatiellae bacterium]|nr:MBL fold metallo-hydrolase [Kiritimatiellia bacterium]
MSVSIQFFGMAGYKIVTADDVHVVIDPFMDDNPYSPVKSDDLDRVDLLLITHNAFDHFGDAHKIAKKHACRVVCAVDVMQNLVGNHGVDKALIHLTIWAMALEVCGVAIRPVESRHWSFGKTHGGHLLSGPAMGFVFDAGDGKRIYHPGDTALFSDMRLIRDLYRPTVGLMHVSLPNEEGVGLPHPECYRSGELTPKEALMASEWLGLEEVVVSHYVDPNTADVKEFCRLVEQNRQDGAYAPPAIVLGLGETHVWETPGADAEKNTPVRVAVPARA